MNNILIRKVVRKDFAEIININELFVKETSPLNKERLTHLNNIASYHKVAVVNEQISGFLLAINNNEDYSNENYAWFSERYNCFTYIDRIVIKPEFSGLKIGSLLYKDLFQSSLENQVKHITCEYNIRPINIPSQKFHEKFGFSEVGQQDIANGKKRVSLQLLEL